MITIDELELGITKRIPEEFRGYVTLWWCVLDLALRDAAKHENTKDKPYSRSREAAQAHQWVFSNSEAASGFIWVCDVIGMNPEVVRSKFKANWRNLLLNQKEL